MGIAERESMRKSPGAEPCKPAARRSKRRVRTAISNVMMIALLIAGSGSHLSWAGSQSPPVPPIEDKAFFDTSDLTVIKRSRNNICHVPGSPSYSQTLEFRAYRTLRDCLDSGGRGPGGSNSIVNINTASASELGSLRGIGPALAQRIIEGRPYKSVEDLRRIQGINSRLIEGLRPSLTTEGGKEGR